MDEVHGEIMKSEYDFGGIFGEASKNHDKIPTTNLRSDEIHPPHTT
ncbi:MAG: hypothetical protein IPL23_28490 [Saprospiraceae bacterium]|nr:hypothetical protein [Saprospiraceae bacterium]